jgi:hypothetical protein
VSASPPFTSLRDLLNSVFRSPGIAFQVPPTVTSAALAAALPIFMDVKRERYFLEHSVLIPMHESGGDDLDDDMSESSGSDSETDVEYEVEANDPYALERVHAE